MSHMEDKIIVLEDCCFRLSEFVAAYKEDANGWSTSIIIKDKRELITKTPYDKFCEILEVG